MATRTTTPTAITPVIKVKSLALRDVDWDPWLLVFKGTRSGGEGGKPAPFSMPVSGLPVSARGGEIGGGVVGGGPAGGG